MTTFTPQPLTPSDSRRADARRNRTAILAAANTVFAEDGWQVGMDRIAASAGVGIGTVYRHFPTKDALAGELLAERYAAMREQAEAIAGRSGSAFDRLAAALAANGDFVQKDLLARRTLNHGGPAAHRHAETARRELEAAYAPLLDDARREGALREDFRAAEVGLLMTAVCATMNDADPSGWRRVLAILIDGLDDR